MRLSKVSPYLLLILGAILLPSLGYCDVQGMLDSAQDKVFNVILPAVSVLGVAWAGLSLVSGNPNARNHLILACFGAAVGFGAPAIVTFMRSIAHG